MKIKSFKKTLIKETAIVDEIKAILTRQEIPPDDQNLGIKLCGAYKRCYLNEYKGLKYLLGDPLDGYYDYVDILDNVLQKEHMNLNKFLATFCG